MPITLVDADGFTWDIQDSGEIFDGSSDAYDGGLVLFIDGELFLGGSTSTELAGRQFETVQTMSNGITVERNIYVPDSGPGFARFFEVFTNTTASAITFTVEFFTDLGSDGSTSIQFTSDGDAAFESADVALVTDDASLTSGDPAVGHLYGDGTGLFPTSTTDPATGSYARSYTITLQPGESTSFAHFATQQATPAEAQTVLEGLLDGTIDGFTGLDTTEVDSIANFDGEVFDTSGGSVLYLNTHQNNLGFELPDELFLFGDAGDLVRVQNNAGFDEFVTLNSEGFFSLVLSPSEQMSFTGINNFGYQITSSEDISAFFSARDQATSDVTIVFDQQSLGQTYIIASQGASDGDGGQFSVQAIADSTVVDVILPDGQSFSVTLQDGESFYFETGDSTGNSTLGITVPVDFDLTGTIVTASEDVAVFAGHECADVPSVISFCDHLIEQMPAIENLSDTYVIGRASGNGTAANMIRVVAPTDGTTVTVDGVVLGTIDAGQFLEFQLTGDAAIVTANNNVLVAQYLQGADLVGEGDPAMTFVPGSDTWLPEYRIAAPAGTAAFAQNFVNVVVPTSALASLTLDGVAVDTSGFTAVPGDATLSVGSFAVPTGQFTVAASEAFQLITFGFDSFDSYLSFGGASFASGISNAPPAPQDDDLGTDEATLITGNLFDDNGNGVDFEPDGDAFEVTAVNGSAVVGSQITLPSGALLTVNADGTYSYDPNGVFDALNSGDTDFDTFTYEVTEIGAASLSSTATVTVTIDGVTTIGVPPDAIDDGFTIFEDEAAGDVDFNVRDNDTNPDGAALDVSEVAGDAANVGTPVAGSNGGLVTINADGSVDFDANGEFEDLAAGETRETTVTYGIDFTGAASVVDVVLLQDLSGSFSDDLPNVQAQFAGLFTTLNSDRDVQFGVASYIDKPFAPFGDIGDFVYNTDLAVTGDQAAIQAALDALVTGSGNDVPESQLEALLQLALRADGEVGYRGDSQRIVVISTDAPFHVAGDFPDNGPNDGDDQIESEDYPSIEQLAAALQAANITPVFSVTSDQIATYQNLVNQLGFGSVVELSSSSDDLADAVVNALAAIDTTDTATLTVTVEGLNDAPDAIDDLFSTDENGAITINVVDLLSNDTDVDASDVLSLVSVDTTGTQGTLVDNLDGTFTYDPNGAFFDLNEGDVGTDTFTYTISDGNGGSDTATVTIDIAGIGGFNEINGTPDNDLLLGTPEPDQINGLEGDDIIIGRDEGDIITGGEGSDIIEGGAGNDLIVGGNATEISGEQTTSAEGIVPSTGQELTISLTAPDASSGTSVTVSGFVSAGDVLEPPLNIAFIVDVSGSTSGGILAGEVDAVEAFALSVVNDLGLGDSQTALISFESSASTDFTGQIDQDSNFNGVLDIVETAETYSSSGGTSFESGLQQAITFFNGQSFGDNVVIFLSDGFNNGGPFADETATLLDPAGLDAQIFAFGITAGASEAQLDLLDDGIDNDSVPIILDPANLSADILNPPIDPADVDRVDIFVNGVLNTSVPSSALTASAFGLGYNIVLTGLDPNGDDVIEAVVVATDPAATSVSTSQTLETLTAAALAGQFVFSEDPTNADDVLVGGAGDDRIFGVSGDDRLFGDQGDDTLSGGDGNDEVSGDAGNDTIFADAGDDTIDGGAGFDTFDLTDQSDGVSVDLDAGTASGVGIGNDTFTGIERVLVGSGDDILIGSDALDDILAGC